MDTEAIGRLVDYVLSMSQPDSAAQNHPGQVSYQQFCLACHGPDGAGNAALGAPSLIDDDWLYGSGEAALIHTITKGRYGIMPAFGERMDDVQVRMLVAWLTRD